MSVWRERESGAGGGGGGSPPLWSSFRYLCARQVDRQTSTPQPMIPSQHTALYLAVCVCVSNSKSQGTYVCYMKDGLVPLSAFFTLLCFLPLYFPLFPFLSSSSSHPLHSLHPSSLASTSHCVHMQRALIYTEIHDSLETTKYSDRIFRPDTNFQIHKVKKHKISSWNPSCLISRLSLNFFNRNIAQIFCYLVRRIRSLLSLACCYVRQLFCAVTDSGTLAIF